MPTITELSPKAIWSYFNEICQIPRPSKKEEKIIQYLINFAKTHNLQYKQDKIGNVLILKPATPGMENRKTVILQSHVDMVCEKNNDTQHDFTTDPIKPYIDGDWVKAKGTTLGADDGIGVAAELAILAATDIKHGAIECLFTVDEETGLSGAFALQKGFMTGEILLNLDSEDEGELYIGCAGGIDTLVDYKYQLESVPPAYLPFRITVNGLVGGHSGGDIHLGLGNANKILANFLNSIKTKTDLRLQDFDGGNLRNAIAREASALIFIPSSYKENLRVDLNGYIAEVEDHFKNIEPHLRIELESTTSTNLPLSKAATDELLQMLYDCPHGVIAMSDTIEGLVDTSTNLASVKFTGNNTIRITTSQRSSSEPRKEELRLELVKVFNSSNTKIIHSDGYPGWAPSLNSPILNVSKEAYERLFNTVPDVKAIHAGLECGLFLEKYPFLDMVSFGPTIYGAHSPDERINIETVQKFWDYTVEVLANIPEK